MTDRQTEDVAVLLGPDGLPRTPAAGTTPEGGELGAGVRHWHRRRADHSVDEWLVGAELDAPLQSLLASLSKSVGAALNSQLGKM